LRAVCAARQLRDDTTVFAGVGVPLLAAALAKLRHARRLTMVIEGGIIGPEIAPGRLPVSTNEMRAGLRATMLPGMTDAFLFAQRGFVDVGFMGGSRRAAGLLFGGVSRVGTTLGLLGFDPDSKRMRIEATHPGVSIDMLRQNTGFPLLEAPRLEVTEPPSDEELEMLRALDPERRFLG